MISFNRNQLAATVPTMAKKDLRHYLNGVLFEVCANGDVHLVSTDGNHMFCGLIPAPYVAWTVGPQSGPFRMIIPRDAVVAALKTKNKQVILSALSDGRYSLGDVIFSPIDGTYPDWRRVSVSADVLNIRGEKAAQFEPDLLVNARDALKAWFDAAPRFKTYLHAHANQAGVMTGDDMTAYCIVMPLRIQDMADIRPFTPASYE